MLPRVLAALGFLVAAYGQELLAAGHAFQGIVNSASLAKETSQKKGGPSNDTSLDVPAPANITGVYRGTWRSLERGEGKSGLLRNQEGLVIYQLRTFKSNVEGVHNVEGELVVRDGVYVTEYDIEMKLQGVYVPQTGRLHATLEGKSPSIMMVALDDADTNNQSAAYRQALREAGYSWAAPSMLSPLRFVSTPERQPLRKKCEFRADIVVQGVPAVEGKGGAPSPAERGRRLQDVPDGYPGTDSGDESWPEQEAAIMNGTISSPNCHMELQLNATTNNVEAYFAKAINYTLMITGLSFAQVLFLLRQMEATSTPSVAAKVSLATVGAQAIMDAYLCLLHLTIGIMVEQLFNAYATAAFFEFVIFAIFEMRYLLSIWVARRQASAEDWGPQRELTILYARFYGALLGGIFLTYQLQRYMKYIVFVLYSFWVPQIVYCARQDVRQPLRPAYVLGMSVTRLALPLYLFGCPHNLLRVPFSPGVCLALTVYLALQVMVLLSQTMWGPRCFIPKRFLPAKYNYYRPITPRQLAGEADDAGDVETGDGGVECVICMNPVEVDRAAARMVTPCGHFFHPGCLNRWMDVKMECPTCRRPLPTP